MFFPMGKINSSKLNDTVIAADGGGTTTIIGSAIDLMVANQTRRVGTAFANCGAAAAVVKGDAITR